MIEEEIEEIGHVVYHRPKRRDNEVICPGRPKCKYAVDGQCTKRNTVLEEGLSCTIYEPSEVICPGDPICRYAGVERCLRKKDVDLLRADGFICEFYKPSVDYWELQRRRIKQLKHEKTVEVLLVGHLHRALQLASIGITDNRKLRSCPGQARNLQWGLIYGFFKHKYGGLYELTEVGKEALRLLNEGKITDRWITVPIKYNAKWGKWFMKHIW
jgi:hypothetical protein